MLQEVDGIFRRPEEQPTGMVSGYRDARTGGNCQRQVGVSGAADRFLRGSLDAPPRNPPERQRLATVIAGCYYLAASLLIATGTLKLRRVPIIVRWGRQAYRALGIGEIVLGVGAAAAPGMLSEAVLGSVFVAFVPALIVARRAGAPCHCLGALPSEVPGPEHFVIDGLIAAALWTAVWVGAQPDSIATIFQQGPWVCLAFWPLLGIGTYLTMLLIAGEWPAVEAQ